MPLIPSIQSSQAENKAGQGSHREGAQGKDAIVGELRAGEVESLQLPQAR